ncbi:hypothetical protein SDC9_211182 [bioreactor metagenome]|uniref:Uncharacterized protein n=1 Tax=bioreactor metagenome TaxID=1076179 RepID=A0A645JW44_9ZZZZ
MRQPCFQTLRVLRACAQTSAVWRAQHHGHRALAAEHVARLRGLVDQRIHGQRDEVHEHDFDDGLQAGERRAHGRRGDRRFGNRRVDHAFFAELLQQPACGLERAARMRDILAHHDHRGVLCHAVGHGLGDCVHITHFSRGAHARASCSVCV